MRTPNAHFLIGFCRGPLSDENLTVFCKYFLKECVDQIGFMSSILELHELEARLHKYLGRSNAGLVMRELLYKDESAPQLFPRLMM